MVNLCLRSYLISELEEDIDDGLTNKETVRHETSIHTVKNGLEILPEYQ